MHPPSQNPRCALDKNAKLSKDQQIACRSDELLALKFKDKKDVIVITGLSISFEVASSFWKVGVSLRREPPRGVWGHAPPENVEI